MICCNYVVLYFVIMRMLGVSGRAGFCVGKVQPRWHVVVEAWRYVKEMKPYIVPFVHKDPAIAKHPSLDPSEIVRPTRTEQGVFLRWSFPAEAGSERVGWACGGSESSDLLFRIRGVLQRVGGVRADAQPVDFKADKRSPD